MAGPITAGQIKAAADGKLSDGRGLFLIKNGPTGRWVYRYQIHGRRRDMGIGAWPEVSLASARRERDRWAAQIHAGRDPIDIRQAERDQASAEAETDDPTFSAAAQRVLEAIAPTLKNGGKAGRWISPIETHLVPKIGKRRMSAIRPIEIANALRPIWRTKHPTAEKAANRTRAVFRRCRRMGVDCHEDTVEMAIEHLGAHVHHPRPIPATEWRRIPEVWQQLEDGGTAAAALRFMILTLVRSAGCRGARFDEMPGDIWTVPAARMKGREGRTRDFRVPLSMQAIEIRDAMAELHTGHLFEGQIRGRPITDRSIARELDRIGEKGRPHGFRTSFRSWVQDTDATSFEVAETVLAHTIGSAVERAYARSDMIEKRRIVMARWADFVTGAEAQRNVVPMRGDRLGEDHDQPPIFSGHCGGRYPAASHSSTRQAMGLGGRDPSSVSQRRTVRWSTPRMEARSP